MFVSLSSLQVPHVPGCLDITILQFGSVRLSFLDYISLVLTSLSVIVKKSHLQLAPSVGRLFNTSESGHFDSSCHVLGPYHLNLPDLHYCRL